LPPDSSANSAPSPDWDAIAHDYAESDLTVSEICALYSISCSVLYDRAGLDGWVKRSAARRTARDRRPSPPPSGAKATDLARRMLTALDHKMTEFETRMTQAAAGAAPITAADSERDARTLNTLVRLFDKLKGFGTKAPSSARAPAPGSRASGKDIHDADRYRNDLARRLERLRDGIGG
jgi:hypothetical protein